MIYSRIAGTGSYLPPRVMTNAEFAARLDTSDAWIRERTGIVQRHIAEKSQASSDLALEASRRAIDAAGLKPNDIDLIIVATSTPDYIFPSTACLLQAKLGVKGCPAFDVQAVCSGFVYALATADSFIRNKMAKTALVVGAEVFSRILDWNDRGTCVLFGDGAGAVVLCASEKPGIHASVLHADGSQVDLLSVPGNVCGGAIVGSPFLQMNGQGVFKFAVRVLDEAARETVAAAGMQMSDVDWLIPHQANVRILEATARRLGLPLEKLVVTVDHHGNTSAASIPLALDEFVRAGKIRPGQRVLMEGVGGGFTWGASLVTL
ncbi:MAG: 3-oxoacyl-(acyl-carrier-protein) synthase [Burkholderiales bacterium]|jgi:3-oxoacyl-[acyl-carrier-protein] synthase-3|nr:3-oxoacyl-(acyl-carrier-protein) synthase [Burkholderiales bacterium]